MTTRFDSNACCNLAAELLRDNEILFAKITKALDCDRSLVPHAMTEVLRFMFLCSISNGVLTPSHRVDLAWHEFILCTRAYQRFCDKQFGRFIHHTPGGSDESNHIQFQETLRLYQQHFGNPDPCFWGPMRNGLDDAACGSCETI